MSPTPGRARTLGDSQSVPSVDVPPSVAERPPFGEVSRIPEEVDQKISIGLPVEVDVADGVVRYADELGHEDDKPPVLAGHGGRPAIGGQVGQIPGQPPPIARCAQPTAVHEVGHASDPGRWTA
jgi:hypothetical protein